MPEKNIGEQFVSLTTEKGAEEKNQEKPIKIDPEFLEHIRQIKPNAERHQTELTRTRFASHAIEGELFRIFYEHLDNLDIAVVKEKIKSEKKELEEAWSHHKFKIPDDVDDKAIKDMFIQLESYLPFYDSSFHFVMELDARLSSKLRYPTKEEPLSETERKISKLEEIMHEYLKDSKVVDLGAGYGDFFWEASVCKAKEYIAIDDPKGNGEEERVSSKLNKNTQKVLEIFSIEIEPCKNKYIHSDILEGLYTKIPDDSSCFVIFGVDESYPFTDEYINLCNKLIAEKTKIGGVVVCYGSIIGYGMPKNFEQIYEQGVGSYGVHVYLRKN